MRHHSSSAQYPWPTAIVFDFDGLLMDTESTMLASWRYEWQQWGLSLDEAGFFADHGGDINEEKYVSLAAAVGPAYDRPLSHARRLAFRDALHADLGLSPGLGRWIEEGVSAGLLLAVASSSPRDWVERHLSRVGLLGRFEALACGDEVDAPKPAPDVYDLALDQLGIAGRDAVAVEDTPHGVAAAQAAGLEVVAIPNAYVDPALVAGAELVLETAAGVALRDALDAVRPGGGERRDGAAMDRDRAAEATSASQVPRRPAGS